MLEARKLTLPDRLAAVSTTLTEGTITAILGPNGAGKSTLLGCLAGLIVPTGGEVRLDASVLARLTPQHRARAIGFLPQTPEVAWDMTVTTLVGLGRLPWRTSSAEDRLAIDTALATMDLIALASRPISQLSGGERARALMARVLAGEPRWLLADEPLTNLDLAHQLALLARLRDQARGGAGVLLVLHDLAQAMNHAGRVLVLDRGRLVADGAPEEVLSEGLIAQVWGVQARWLGEAGQRALSAG